MSTRFFRAGIGIVIYTKPDTIALFRRKKHPMGIWQFPQGGIEVGEIPDEALWRELHEEVGLRHQDIEHTTKMTGWTVYEDMPTPSAEIRDRIGQVHTWYFLKLRNTSVIDLKNALDEEFDDYQWTTFTVAIEHANDKKRHVYEELQQFFETQITTTLKT